MRTRKNPKNQDKLFKALFKADVNANLLQAAKAARAELAAMHGYLYPRCDGGCPADAILQQLANAIAQAEAATKRA